MESIWFLEVLRVDRAIAEREKYRQHLFTMSAITRYGSANQPSVVARTGHGLIKGHQKRIDVPRKQKCSNSCQCSFSSAKLKAAGICHPRNIRFMASQATRGVINQ